MSEPFERRLAERTLDELKARQLEAGDRLVAEFDTADLAGGFIEAIYEVDNEEAFTVEFEEVTQSVPGFRMPDGLPVYAVRVRREGIDESDASWEEYDVTQGYATTLRNKLAQVGTDAALLLSFASGVEIDTLDTTRELFADDGIIPLSEFRDGLLSDGADGDLSKPARALLDGLNPYLGEGGRPSISELRVLARIRDALENGNDNALPDLIADIGPFIKADRLENWLEEEDAEGDLRSRVEEMLSDNQKHAQRFEGAHDVGVSTREKLAEDYEEDFVEKVLATSDWKRVDHTDAKQHELRGGGGGADPKFESLAIDAEASKVYSAETGSQVRRGILALPSPDGVTLELTFTKDVSDEPVEFVSADGTEIGSVAVDENELRATLDAGNPEEPRFGSLNVYIGHKTRRGNPKCKIDLAVLPRWAFTAVQADALDVDVEHEALVSHDESPITLAWNGDGEPEPVTISGETEDVTLDRNLRLEPDPPPQVAAQTVVVHGEGAAPVTIRFLSGVAETVTERIDFPLMLTALAQPDAWGDDRLRINDSVSIDTSKGELHPPNRAGVEFPTEDLRLLQIEEHISDSGNPRGRVVDGTSVAEGEVANPGQELPDALETAYEELFDHFNARDRTPSTARWDEPTIQAARRVLEAFEETVRELEDEVSPVYEVCRGLGTITSGVTDARWLTPYHPSMLCYAVRLATWRDDELLVNDATEGFNNDRFTDLFDPSGLLPYARGEDGGLLQGRMQRPNHLWARFDRAGGLGSKTPEYIDQVIAEKLDAFRNAFPVLFELHSERQIVINLVNMGDLKPVIEGLFDFIRKLESPSDCPRLLLRIYGGPTEGEEVEKFFSEAARSSLQADLAGRNSEVEELLQRRVYFVRKRSFDGADAKPAHMTFFRGMLTEGTGKVSYHTLPSALRRDGLLPHESIKVSVEDGEIHSRVGFGDDQMKDSQLRRVARLSNALEAQGSDAFNPELTLTKTVSSSGKTNLETIWDKSLWVSHVEPKVGIEFYLESEAETVSAPSTDDSTLMIHYSDQYNPSSPNFDVITTTRKRDPYVQALQTALHSHAALDQLDPKAVLRQLVAIDGALALDLLRAKDTRVTELIGFVGGLAVARSVLQVEFDDHVWVPVSLAELARHDRSRRGNGQGLLQYDPDGPASDDICMVGVPTADSEDLDVKLWLVETKGGHASISKGREQVIRGRENLQRIFHPDEGFADTPLVRAEFGRLVQNIADRLASYDVLTETEKEAIAEQGETLRDGTYEVSFLRDDDGHIGEVIRVQSDKEFVDFGSEDRVRSLALPMRALRILSEGIRIEDVFDVFPYNEISFSEGRVDTQPKAWHVAGEAPVAGETDAAGNPTETASNPEPTRADGQHQPTVNSAVSNGEATEDDATESAESASREEPTEETEATDTKVEETEEASAEQLEETPDTAVETEGPSESTAEDTESPESSADTGGYDWTPRALAKLIETLEESPTHAPDVNVPQLVDTLTTEFDSLGVDIHRPNPADVAIGPRKIGINVLPKRGQKIEGILRSLDSVSVHIQAAGTITGEPNPSEGAVRIEIPHDDPRDVYLREGLEATGEALFEPLVIPLGITSDNEHRTLNLLEERHALIAGSTGSGKSNFLSSVIVSLAATQPPDRLSLSLLDPKGVDFGRFASLPHVGEGEYIDTPEASAEYLLDVVESELPKRQKRLQASGATNIREHNELAASDDFDVEPMPYRVIVIDEYADLTMSVDDPDVLEQAVTRIAQKGRAMGYILLLATQRPSADIVSGKIKANFPCRISFKLPSNTDSRVILDKPGAEDLGGDGEMIVLTQAGDEHHLQGYLLTARDGLQAKELLDRDAETGE